ncbi:hypothetical protein B0H66DRAFT_555127 [Apodospora peruviana]|uniref:F-box domain-containing protein n=1 Tax=Apodospora peruviana TaxID=516989 RepID=A0AAE0ICR4_9PEZI|nr:hypothetical protein B0H66DRAFT_555127 [Apodospora peruviana]
MNRLPVSRMRVKGSLYLLPIILGTSHQQININPQHYHNLNPRTMSSSQLQNNPPGEHGANASHVSGTRSLLNLAPEVVSNVIEQVDGNDTLKSLRLVNKSMDAHARRKLYEQVTLTPAHSAITRWQSIADSETLSLLPRHALIQTREDLDEHAQEGDPIDEMDDFCDALAALSKFPRLDSLELAFTNECQGVASDEHWYMDVNEDLSHRVEILERVFRAIKNRMDDDGVPRSKIRSLTLRNLQNAPIDTFTDSELFSAVMQQLDELHIGMIQEYNEHGPDHDYKCLELQTFPGHLVAKWLKPVAANLKALSLYSRNENWGCFPGYFDPSGISFPKLETLSLGYYTLTYDDQLDWILAQKSLTKLVMHRCMIAPLMRIDKENVREWKPSKQGWEELSSRRGGDDWCNEFRYRGTWSQFFDKIADGLPNLKEFCFEYPKSEGSYDFELRQIWSGKGYGVENRDFCGGAEAFAKRYVVFNNGILPTHWPEAKDDGEITDYFDPDDGEDQTANFHKEFLEEDQRSLERLLEKCRARREATDGK